MSFLIGIHYGKIFILERIVNGFQIRQCCALRQKSGRIQIDVWVR